MPSDRDRSGASTRRTPPPPAPRFWKPWVSDTKGIFCWFLLKPSGEEKGEHLEGRSRGLGRLGGTSALSRAHAMLGAGARRAGSALSAGHRLTPGKKGLILSSLGSCFPSLPLHSHGCLLFPFPGQARSRVWKFQGELALGAEEEGKEVVQLAQSHQQPGRLQLARASPPVLV